MKTSSGIVSLFPLFCLKNIVWLLGITFNVALIPFPGVMRVLPLWGSFFDIKWQREKLQNHLWFLLRDVLSKHRCEWECLNGCVLQPVFVFTFTVPRVGSLRESYSERQMMRKDFQGKKVSTSIFFPLLWVLFCRNWVQVTKENDLDNITLWKNNKLKSKLTLWT